MLDNIPGRYAELLPCGFPDHFLMGSKSTFQVGHQGIVTFLRAGELVGGAWGHFPAGDAEATALVGEVHLLRSFRFLAMVWMGASAPPSRQRLADPMLSPEVAPITDHAYPLATP